MYELVLVRHGESLWNRNNLFTGWTDIDLSKKGIEEAIKAGQLLKREEYNFDLVYTSYLKRAIKTMWLILSEMGLEWLPVRKSWRLNERHYGVLQGLNKLETVNKYGEEQVHIWRRSYNTPPPELDEEDEHYPGHDPRYKHLNKNDLPRSECLADTLNRFLPYWEKDIIPAITSGSKVLIVAHGNSLRALVKILDKVSDSEITSFNIPTGIALDYQLVENLQPRDHFYLGDQAAIEKAINNVKNQIVKK